MMNRITFALAPIAAALLLSACGGVDPGSPQQPDLPPAAASVAVTIDPTAASVAPAGNARFAAAVTGTVNTSVTWSVTEASGGTVDANGLYVAPSSSGTYHVVVRSIADPTRTATATVTVTTSPTTPPPPPPPPAPTAACATEPLRATGATYYVCDCQGGAAAGCVAGSDANPGTTPDQPWQSFSKAASTFGTMPAGSTVAFCRGGAWTGVSGATVKNKNCQASGTCDMRDYTAPWNRGGEGRPILGGTGGDVFSVGWYRDYSQKIQGFRFFNLDIRNAGYVWKMQGGVTDVDICNVAVSDTTGSVQYVMTNSTTKRISMHHSTFTRVGLAGQAYLGSCDDCVIDSNVFDYCGGPSNRDHPIYVGSNPEPCTSGCNTPVTGGSGTYSVTQRMRITNNRLTHSAMSGGACVGVAIVVHEPHDGLVIDNNLIYEDPSVPNAGCWGISVSNGGDEPGQWKNVRISRNQVYNAGNTPISVENCQDCSIDSNLIVTSQAQTTGILVPWHAQSFGVGPNLENTRTTVRNNTIYFTSASGGGTGISVGTEGTGHVVTNNAVYYAASSAPNGWSCFRFGLGTSAYTAIDDNLCYFPNLPGGRWEASYSTLSGWQAATGFDMHSLQADPRFTLASGSPDAANFSGAAGSPLLGAGNTTHVAPLAIGSVPWSASDAGKSRGSAPDIGAYQQ